MAVQTCGIELFRAIALMLASHEGLITLSEADEAFISGALDHALT
jgi:hypothetical protein